MKSIIPIAFILLFINESAAQLPQAINFQGVAVKDAEILPNTKVGLKLSIIDSAQSGKTVYREFHGKTTNEFGSFQLQVGKPDYRIGGARFRDIDWSTGEKYLNISFSLESDQSDSVDLGTIKMVTVPFAFAAESLTSFHNQNAKKGDVMVFDGDNWVPGDTIQFAHKTGMIDESNAQKGKVLTYNGKHWKAGDTVQHARTTSMINQTLADTGDLLQFNGQQWVPGQWGAKVITKSSNYKIQPSDDVVFGDISGNNVMLSLPDPALSQRPLTIKCKGSGRKLRIAGFSGSSIYTLAGEKVDTVILQQSGNSIALVSDGKDFYMEDLNVSVYYHGFDNSKTNAANGVNTVPSLKTLEKKYDFVSANGRIIPPKGMSGLYQVEMYSKMSGNDLDHHEYLHIRYSVNNGSTVTFGFLRAQIGSFSVAAAKGSFIIRLNEGDELQVYTNQNSGNTQQVETRLYVARVAD